MKRWTATARKKLVSLFVLLSFSSSNSELPAARHCSFNSTRKITASHYPQFRWYLAHGHEPLRSFAKPKWFANAMACTANGTDASKSVIGTTVTTMPITGEKMSTMALALALLNIRESPNCVYTVPVWTPTQAVVSAVTPWLSLTLQ